MSDPTEEVYALLELDELYNDVQSELPGLEPEHGARVCRQAVNRFLERSSTWRYTLTPFFDELGIVKLEAPDCALITHYRDIRWCGPRGKRPSFKTTQTPYELQMLPVVDPFEVGWLAVTLILKMSRSGSKIPDYILDVHYEAMRIACLARLMAEPAKPYTDTAMAMLYSRQAKSFESEARDIAERQYGRQESKWQYPRWV